MFNLLIIVVMVGILVTLASALFFFVKDGTTDRMVTSLGIRAALGVMLLGLLALGFMYNLG